ncbi:helix-turn-helix domain-containing protein [Larkinella sp. VNQ87]|uniref:helix-turn-helix domain-containing protein n=1 Tax=Larkinella sp. VNQ87 TaxID=3400921 RepID=UPI003BFE28EA
MVQQLVHCHAALKPYVKDILVLEGCESVATPNTFRFFADGCPGIIFQQSSRGMLLNALTYPTTSFFLYGQTIKPVEITARGRFRLLIFFLYPHAILPLLGIRADTLTGTCVDLGPLPTLSGLPAFERLFQSDSVTDQVELVSSCILRMLQLNHPSADRALNFAVDQIWTAQGNASLPELHRTLNISERTFERRFEQYVGISPRLFARICRFQASLQQLKNRDYSKLSDIAFDNGYADQSHFIRTFREFTGFSPLKLPAQPDPFRYDRASVY